MDHARYASRPKKKRPEVQDPERNSTPPARSGPSTSSTIRPALRPKLNKSNSISARRTERPPAQETQPGEYIDRDFTKFYGVQACRAIFKMRRSEMGRVFISPRLKDEFADVMAWCESRHLPCKLAGDGEISKVAMTQHHEGICMEARPAQLRSYKALIREYSMRPASLLVYLDGVENPHNLGAVMRTCAFFGVDALMIESREIVNLSGAACRVAEGAAEYLPVAIVRRNKSASSTAAIEELRRAGFSVCATTPHDAQNAFELSWPKKLVLLFGAEGPGLSDEKLAAATVRASIPGLGKGMESLNVGSAVSIFLAQVRGAGKKV